MVKCHVVLLLLSYSFSPPGGVELAECAPGEGRRQWHCAYDPSVPVFVPVTPQCLSLCPWPLSACSCEPSVPMTPQCLFLCQANCVLAHPSAVADAVECPELCKLLWAAGLSLQCWKWPGCMASVDKENRNASKSTNHITWKAVRHMLRFDHAPVWISWNCLLSIIYRQSCWYYFLSNLDVESSRNSMFEKNIARSESSAKWKSFRIYIIF